MLRRNGSSRGSGTDIASRLRSIGSFTRLRRRSSRSNSPTSPGENSGNSGHDHHHHHHHHDHTHGHDHDHHHHHHHHHHPHSHHHHHEVGADGAQGTIEPRVLDSADEFKVAEDSRIEEDLDTDSSQPSECIDEAIERRRLKPVNSASGMSQEDLRRTIRDIQCDTSLSGAERAKRIQELMTFSWRKSQQDLHAKESSMRRGSTKSLGRLRSAGHLPPAHGASGLQQRSQSSYFNSEGRTMNLRHQAGSNQTASEVDSDFGDDEEVEAFDEDEMLKSYHDEANNILGCEHYQRKCMISAPCCNEFFPCRFCHNEEMDHEIDRYAVDRVRCMVCSKEQPVARECIDCGTEFARYFCEPCKFYDDKEGKAIYHCPKCNICRIGEGLGIDYFHCDKCNACMSITLRDHKCVERSLESDCPVCHEYMFTSTTPVMFLNCGHCMHVSCYESYTASNYTCPLCSKSLGDMSAYFRRIDQLLEQEKMPSEYQGLRSRIFCSDCETRSIAPYHFVYHKCKGCGSYNTKVLEQLPREDSTVRV